VPPPQKIFDYLVLKWCILMHISGILTYLFESSALQRKAEYMYMNTRQSTKGSNSWPKSQNILPWC